MPSLYSKATGSVPGLPWESASCQTTKASLHHCCAPASPTVRLPDRGPPTERRRRTGCGGGNPRRPLDDTRAPPNRYHLGIMGELPRITLNPKVMGGKPCIRGMRVTVSTVVGLVATEHSHAEILDLYPYLEEEDILQALQYAAWRAGEVEIPLASA